MQTHLIYVKSYKDANMSLEVKQGMEGCMGPANSHAHKQFPCIVKRMRPVVEKMVRSCVT